VAQQKNDDDDDYNDDYVVLSVTEILQGNGTLLYSRNVILDV